jgi:hypothetical protein
LQPRSFRLAKARRVTARWAAAEYLEYLAYKRKLPTRESVLSAAAINFMVSADFLKAASASRPTPCSRLSGSRPESPMQLRKIRQYCFAIITFVPALRHCPTLPRNGLVLRAGIRQCRNRALLLLLPECPLLLPGRHGRRLLDLSRLYSRRS